MALAVKIELFKRGCFDFITVKDGKKHEKQEKALQILTDNEHAEFLYGGGAGGANVVNIGGYVKDVISGSLVIMIVMTVVYYAVSVFLLNRKLNLD